MFAVSIFNKWIIFIFWLHVSGLNHDDARKLHHEVASSKFDIKACTGCNKKQAIVFTTVSLASSSSVMVNWTKNWVLSLQNVGIARPLVIGSDTGQTCRELFLNGICSCVTYAAAHFEHAPDYLPLKNFRDGKHLAAVDLKYAYANLLLRKGYVTIFSDSDVFWKQHPLSNYSENADFEGLSDDRDGRDLLDWRDTPACGLSYGAPCMSTGLWRATPGPQTINLIGSMIGRLLNTTTWEQALFNQVVNTFNNKHPDFTFRILAKDRFHNVGVLEKRVSAGMSVDSVAIHLGYVHGHEKIVTYQRMGLWRPDGDFRPSLCTVDNNHTDV
jgi:hypothetical protein